MKLEFYEVPLSEAGALHLWSSLHAKIVAGDEYFVRKKSDVLEPKERQLYDALTVRFAMLAATPVKKP